MFRHEGPSRSHRANEVLAAFLATIAGFVNAVGFTLLGAFTSHVTGNVARFGDDLARSDVPAGIFAAGLVATYFLGTVLTAVVLATPRRRTAVGYGIVLLIEATLLVAFVAAPFPPRTETTARLLDLHASLLCAAMGTQNALVTRLSGAVVRTTHLTGAITDLGIETARWIRWLVVRAPRAERPSPQVGLLLATIAASFTVGSVLGAIAALAWERIAALVPAAAVTLAAVQAFASETSRAGSVARGDRPSSPE